VQDYIIEINKLLPTNICDKLISYFDDFQDANVTGQFEGDKLKNTRNCQMQSLLRSQDTLGKTLVVKRLAFYIQDALNYYKKLFPFCHADEISEIDMLKYESNGYNVGYEYHSDFSKDTPHRLLSCSIALNNDYYGGEFEFNLNGQIVRKNQNIGDCLIFPSNFVFPHSVTPVVKGTRYAIISWIK
jgi:predicted 2-oxoglutarate/Fe(II)-dependent dioxygenase YbiX